VDAFSIVTLGLAGSFSHEAALYFAEKLGINKSLVSPSMESNEQTVAESINRIRRVDSTKLAFYLWFLSKIFK